MSAPGFAARLRQLRSKRYEDWWHIVFGGPVGVFLAALAAEVRWITPNRVTLVGFAMRLVAAGLLLLGSRGADLTVVVLLQVSIALDIMDGSLARYRRQPSALGAFLDKITDGVSLAVLSFCLGARAFADGYGIGTVLAAAFIGGSYLLRCYMYWVVAYMEQERGMTASIGPKAMRPFGELNLGERMRYYLGSSWRILLAGEGDVYFWLGLFLLLGCPGAMVVPLACVMGFWTCTITAKRVWRVMQLDARR